MLETIAPPVVVSVEIKGPDLKQKDLDRQLLEALSRSGFAEISDLTRAFVVFDLSRCYWYDLGAVLWLITVLHKLKKQGNDLQLLLAEPDGAGKKLWGFLIRWKFFDCLRQNVDLPVNLLRPSQTRYLDIEPEYGYSYGVDDARRTTVFHSTQLLEMYTLGIEPQDESEREKTLYSYLLRYFDQPIIGALALTCGWKVEDASLFVRKVIGEAVRNASLHARGSFSIVSMRLDPRHVTFAIADNGVGIPDSLRAIKPELAKCSDAELIVQYADPSWILDSYLIKQSVQKGVGGAGRPGDGLYYLKTNVLGHGGELRIRSGRALVEFCHDDPGEVAIDDLVLSPGTTIRIIVPRKVDAQKRTKF